ncbi:hypothetical protein [Roseovarius sp.]|uniref:hypothetical protein n=1 Tax=Roseovarius sp. TaxID=1486281 RepID=UPI003561E652
MESDDVNRIRQADGAAELLEARYDFQRNACTEASEAVERLEQRLFELAGADDGLVGPEFQASGAAMAWRLWAEQRRETILLELANARADQAQQKAKLRKAYGRMSAMRQITETMQGARKSEVSRKAADVMSEVIVAAAVCQR